MGLAESALEVHREVTAAYAAGVAAGKAIGYRHGCNDRSQADADLLDDIRRAGCPTTPWGECHYCQGPQGEDSIDHQPQPECIWRRIEARGERS